DIPFASGPPLVRMGTRRIAVGDWLQRDAGLEGELAAKEELLRERRGEVVAVDEADPGRERAEAATLSLVEAWLEAHDPRPDPPRRLVEGDNRLEAAARSLAEDLCLMRVRAGPPTLVSAVVCSPSYWRLADKIGRPMAAIHRPVPGYGEELGSRPDRLLEGLDGDRIVVRRNWMVHEGGERFSPERPPAGPVPTSEVPDRLWLRSERQTLRSVPGSDHVLFTIRVQQVPLAALAGRGSVRARLADGIRAEAPDRTDRIAGPHVGPALAWLTGSG
ncbi:MAG: DUF3445 domain-containing protein, partial [Actinomycetota bacterium]